MALGYVPVFGGYRAKETEVSECWGTRERDVCDCGGNKNRCTFYPENREKTKLISQSKIDQCKVAIGQLELFDKAETDTVKIFVKQMVGEDTYNRKVNEIYQELKST